MAFVAVAVQRPQLIGEAADERRQRRVGGGSVGPHGVTADRRHDHAAQHGELRERLGISNIRVPLARPGVLGIEFEDRFRAGDQRDGRVRNEGSQQPCEGLMPGFVEMALATEKHDAMAQQGIADCGHRFGRQIAREPHPMDFRPDRRRDRADIEGGVGPMGVNGHRGKVRHVTPLAWTWT